MKKILILIMCAGILTSCGIPQLKFPQANNASEAPTEDIFNVSDLDIDVNDYIEPDYDKFNSLASENGLDGTLVYIDGQFTKKQTEGYRSGIVDSGKGHKWFIMDGLQSLGTGFELFDDGTYDNLEGKNIRVYGYYQGYAQLVDLPAIFIDRILTETGDVIGKGKVVASQFVSMPPEPQPIQTQQAISKEYISALKSAQTYSDMMHMSKKGLYDQLTSEYGDKFSPDAAQYAIDNVNADWGKNALESAKIYQDTMNMSKRAIYDQLISEYGDQFTAEEAQYAIDHLE